MINNTDNKAGRKGVVVELKHNPYLHESKVKFNNKEPHINSLVEKYEDKPLEDWIEKMPVIFRDEMNGYDFELDFWGTLLDFNLIKASFETELKAEDISKDKVRTVCKKEIKEREVKVRELSELLQWLDDNPCRIFDNERFRQENPEISDSTYTVYTVHDSGESLQIPEGSDVVIENINNIEEIKNIDLTDVPIIYMVNSDTAVNLQKDLKFLLERKKVKQKQIFFMPDDTVSASRAERIIKDLGVSDPCMIQSAEDKAFKKYCMLYPVTDYIFSTLKKLRNIVESLKRREDVEKKKHEEANKEIYKKTDELDDAISRLKDARTALKEKEGSDVPESWHVLEYDVLKKIEKWRGKKLNTANDLEASAAAHELNEKVQQCCNNFVHDLKKETDEYVTAMKDEYCRIYKDAGEDPEYIRTFKSPEIQVTVSVPYIEEDLLSIKTEKYVTPKDDLFGAIFKQSSSDKKAPVLERTYQFEKWREYAVNILRTLAEELIDKNSKRTQEYFYELSEKLQEQLGRSAEDLAAEKDKVSMQLSADEQKFQADMKWLDTFDDKLSDIERG